MLGSGALLPLVLALVSPLEGPFNAMIAASLLLCIAIVAMYYLFSKFLSSPQLEAFAREELSQLIFTGLIFASFVFLNGAIVLVASAAICGGASCNHISLAIYSLEKVQSLLALTYGRLYSYEVAIGLLSTVAFNVPLFPFNSPYFAVWLQLQPLGGLEPISNALVTVIESVGYLYGLAWGREMLVYFFNDTASTILLPLGFFMRAFPFSRKTGSSLIALAFAGYFAYPFSILLSQHMITVSAMEKVEVVKPMAPPLICDPPGDVSAVEYVNMTNRELAEDWASGISGVSGDESIISIFAEGITDFVKSFFGDVISKYNFDLLSPDFAPFIHFAYFYVLSRMVTIAQLAVLVLITFVFEIIITVTAFRSISSSLGGEIEILGLTKVV